mmetsp:Transcript_18227/g.52658  ORF Transcript_18227/g.52658 Transcript_18227/m.52658 type:complete len:401 (+) Transcript_18227:454-1656(+)
MLVLALEHSVAGATVLLPRLRVDEGVAPEDGLEPTTRLLAAPPLLAGRRLGGVAGPRPVRVHAEGVVREDGPEALLEAPLPLEVIHHRPSEVATEIDFILVDRLPHLRDVAGVESDAAGVEGAGVWLICRGRPAVLGHYQRRVVVAVFHPVKDLPEPPGRGEEPLRLRLRKAVVREEGEGGVVPGHRGVELRERGAVVVKAEKVRTTLQQLPLGIAELWQPIAENDPHLGRVVPRLAVDRISQPSQADQHPAFSCGDVQGALGPRFAPIRAVRDADLAPLLRLVLAPVELHGSGVCEEHVVPGDQGVDGYVAVFRDARRLPAARSQKCEGPRLVEGDPVLDAVAEGAVAKVHVVEPMLHDLPVRPAFCVARPPALFPWWVEEPLRQVPMVQGDEGRDSSR